jgi:heme/copper-type cytochrome/quinol oxidase subunit 3
MSAHVAIDVRHLPDSAVNTKSLLWWGQCFMIVIEGTVLALVAVTYFYIRFWMPHWPPPGADLPGLRWPIVNLLVLLASWIPTKYADKCAEAGDLDGVRVGLVFEIALGWAFVVGRVLLWQQFRFDYASHAYGSVVFTILGLHTMHAVLALAEAMVLLLIALMPGLMHDEQRIGVLASGLYWDFVIASWIPLFVIVYLGPRLL